MKNSVKTKLLILAVFLGIMALGYVAGSTKEKLDHEKKASEYAQTIATVREDLRKAREAHNQEQANHIFAMHKLKETHESTVRSIRNDLTGRLLKSEERGNLYRERVSSASLECRQLAEHTARLDRSLTEGRDLVREFRAHIKKHRVAFT